MVLIDEIRWLESIGIKCCFWLVLNVLRIHQLLVAGSILSSRTTCLATWLMGTFVNFVIFAWSYMQYFSIVWPWKLQCVQSCLSFFWFLIFVELWVSDPILLGLSSWTRKVSPFVGSTPPKLVLEETLLCHSFWDTRENILLMGEIGSRRSNCSLIWAKESVKQSERTLHIPSKKKNSALWHRHKNNFHGWKQAWNGSILPIEL